MAEQSIEERLRLLEDRIAELEQYRATAEEHDIALLARVDAFSSDLHRVERVQLRGFEELVAGEHAIETAIGVITDVLKGQKQAIETLANRVNDLAAAQAQILTLLMKRSPRHD